MSERNTKFTGAADGSIDLAPVDDIRAEAKWAAKALVNSEVERAGKVIDNQKRDSIEASTAEMLENMSLEKGLDLAELNEQIFKARTGRGFIDEVVEKLELKQLSQSVDRSVESVDREKLLGLQQAQQTYSTNEYIEYEAAYIADLMTDNAIDQTEIKSALTHALSSAAKHADLDLPSLSEKLELGQAIEESKQLKFQELEAYGKLRGVAREKHLNDLSDYSVFYEQKLSDASYVARSVIEKESPELSGLSQLNAEASLSEKLVRADIKGELDLVAMKAETITKNADLSDEIVF